jgi:hypothetical protein
MVRILRSVGAVMAGLIVGVIVVGGTEAVTSKLYPLPPGIDSSNMEAVREHVANVPAAALLLVLSGWGIASIVGSWLATRLGPSRHAGHGATVGLLLLSAGVANMMMLPHPAWFWAAALVVFPLCTYLGIRSAGEPEAGGPQSAPAA